MLTNREICKLIVIYVLFSSLWIVATDILLHRSPLAIEDALPWSTAKGLLFIAASASLLYILLAHLKSRVNDSVKTWRETEEQFQFLVENSSDCLVVINDNGYQKYVSSGAENLFGFSREELEGKHLDDIVHPEDIPTIQHAWEKITREKVETLTIQYRHIHKNGDWIDCEAVARNFLSNPTIKGIIASVRDITQRKRSEQALLQRNQFIGTILDNLPIGLAVNRIDHGTATYMNRKFEEIYGWPKEELQDIEQFFENVFADESYRARIKSRVMDDIQSGDPDRMEWTNIETTTKEGEKRIITAKNIPLYSQNLMISTVQDITESQKLEKQLEQVQKLESIGRLAGGVAHDLNNLLTPILGYSEILLENNQAKKEQDEYINEIRRAGLRARDLVQQLLAFSRKQHLKFSSVDINSTIHSFEKLLRRTIPEDIEIVLNLRRHLPLIRGDVGQIEQVLMNLAVNAADAMPNGGRLAISTDVVLFDDHYASTREGVSPGRYVLVDVCDSGCGMDEATAKNVFDPFFSTKGEYGTGLGLATAYGIVKQHNGNIWVTSEPGRGASFKFYLPLAVEEIPETQEEKDSPTATTGSETVLLVEDAVQVRQLARRYMEKAGYTVLEAESGEEAHTIARLHGSRIDLLLTDVVMPGMSGPELYQVLEKEYADMKVLYMSGYTSRVVALRGLVDKDVPFLQKPFDQTSLLQSVRKVLDT